MKTRSRLQAAALSLALMLPAADGLAATHHHRTLHRHKYSRTRGSAVGAVAGALIDHKHPLTGAVLGAAAGNAVQVIRDKQHQ